MAITPRTQSGISIVELLVSLVLGMILVTGVLQVFLSGRQTIATTEAMSRTQENGRFALEFMSQSARQAGYQEPYLLTAKPGIVAQSNCNWPSSADQNCSLNGAGNSSDRVTFILQPSLIQEDAGGARVRRDCAGNSINDDIVIANSYFISAADANNPSPSLTCTTFNIADPNNPSAPVRLVDGIENMQVLYGISTSGDPASVNQFISATRVAALGAWNRVTAVRISILANSITPTGGNEPLPSNFVLLDAQVNAPNDRLARQVFTTTIRFHNIN